MIQTIYAVADGDYSDYRVRALFTTRELAERFIAIEGGKVEERILFDRMPEKQRWYVIQRFRNGPSGKWGPPKPHSFDNWEFDGEPFDGRAGYQIWDYGERCYGRDEAAVAKHWKEKHAAEEARDAGL